MFPLRDARTFSPRPPYLTMALIAINVLVFFATFFGGNFEGTIFTYGTIPSQILQGEGWITLLTSMFLHGDLTHLIGNMWFLWIFGDNLEGNLGTIRFIIFYLLAGVIANVANVWAVPPVNLDIPTIGASGAISGILGGYVVLFPHNKIRAFMMVYFRPYFFNVPAFIYVAFWFLYQLAYLGSPTNIAYMAHLGGFLAGMILVLPLRQKVIRIRKTILDSAKIENGY